MILNLGPNQTRVFRTAEQQNEKGGPIETLVDWDSSKDVLFTRNYQSPIGGMGELVAWDEKSGAVLWAHACRQAEALGKGLMSTLDLTWIESLNSTGSKVVVYDRKGKLVRRLPLLPVNANDIGTSWSRDLKYMAWPDWGRAASINFATTRSASAWAFPLPETFEELSLVWTAEGQLVFAAYSGQAQAGKITFTLFMIDPDRRTGTKIWEGSAGLVKQMDKPWEAAQEWWSRGKPGEPETHRVPPFILAQWDGHP